MFFFLDFGHQDVVVFVDIIFPLPNLWLLKQQLRLHLTFEEKPAIHLLYITYLVSLGRNTPRCCALISSSFFPALNCVFFTWRCFQLYAEFFEWGLDARKMQSTSKGYK